jgi:hypothetical protein
LVTGGPKWGLDRVSATKGPAKMSRKRQAEQDAARVDLENEVTELIAVLANYPAAKGPHFGAPSRCPQCGDFGLVTRVDQAIGRCDNRCPVCKREWVITVRAINEHARHPHPASVATVGTGALTAALTAANPPQQPAARPGSAPFPSFGQVGRNVIRPA